MLNKIICDTCKGNKLYQISNLEFEECEVCKGKGYNILKLINKIQKEVDTLNDLIKDNLDKKEIDLIDINLINYSLIELEGYIKEIKDDLN